MTAVNIAFGNGFPRSSNVGCDCASASYSAEATTPQTVAVSPMCPAASSGLRGAAATENVHDPSAVDASSSLTVIIGRPPTTPDVDLVANPADLRRSANNCHQCFHREPWPLRMD